MKIIVTGSLGNISKPLTKELIQKGHSVTVISSKAERQKEIEALGAQAAIGTMQDVDFLIKAFTGADIVYLMEAGGPENMFNKSYDLNEATKEIVSAYKKAVEVSGVKKVIHLSSVGAHAEKGVGLLELHYIAENILKQLPNDVSIKFMRPGGFFYNLLVNVEIIKTLSKGFLGGVMAIRYYGIGGFLSGKRGVIVANYGGDVMNLLVSPNDIASVIAEEMEMPFEGRSVRYIASEELTCNEVAKILGEAIGKPYLKWAAISDKMLANTMLKRGMNEKMVKGIVEMGAAGRSGKLYEDYYQHRPVLSQTKLKDYAKEFALEFNKNN
jgi:nucleoside-diphosphate-sugar epimerase